MPTPIVEIYFHKPDIISSDLPASMRLVLLTLSLHLNDAGESNYPSLVQLIIETGLTEKCLIKILKRAHKLGLIYLNPGAISAQKNA